MEYDADKQVLNFYGENGERMSESDFQNKYNDFLKKAAKKIMPTKPVD